MNVLEDGCMVAMDEDLNAGELDSVSHAAKEGLEETNINTTNISPYEAEMKPPPENVLFVGNLCHNTTDDEFVALNFLTLWNCEIDMYNP
ncbi:hypothetical protein M0R45_017470 [Rubus argutus]|uniref:Uncharacterized protein n=1 Tax=Rubus argutus TaxID=59490 RepID=A0AAW1XY61_RUBAR